MNQRRVSPGGTALANAITERNHAIKRLTLKHFQGFGYRLAHLDALLGKGADRQQMDRLCWMTPGTVRLDLSLAQVFHQRLGHLRTGAVARTEEQKTRWGTVKVEVGGLSGGIVSPRLGWRLDELPGKACAGVADPGCSKTSAHQPCCAAHARGPPGEMA